MIEAQQIYQVWTTLHQHREDDGLEGIAVQFEEVILQIAANNKIDEAVGDVLNNPHTFDLTGDVEGRPLTAIFYEDIVCALTTRMHLLPQASKSKTPSVATCELFGISCYGDQNLAIGLHENKDLSNMLKLVLPAGVKGHLLGVIPVEHAAALLMNPQAIHQAMNHVNLEDLKALAPRLQKVAQTLGVLPLEEKQENIDHLVLGGFVLVGLAIGTQPVDDVSFLQSDALTEENMEEWNGQIQEWAEQYIQQDFGQTLSLSGPEPFRDAVVQGLVDYVATSLSLQHEITEGEGEWSKVEILLQNKELTPYDKIKAFSLNDREEVTGSVELQAMTSALLLPDLLQGLEEALDDVELVISLDQQTVRPRNQTLH